MAKFVRTRGIHPDHPGRCGRLLHRACCLAGLRCFSTYWRRRRRWKELCHTRTTFIVIGHIARPGESGFALPSC